MRTYTRALALRNSLTKMPDARCYSTIFPTTLTYEGGSQYWQERCERSCLQNSRVLLQIKVPRTGSDWNVFFVGRQHVNRVQQKKILYLQLANLVARK